MDCKQRIFLSGPILFLTVLLLAGGGRVAAAQAVVTTAPGTGYVPGAGYNGISTTTGTPYGQTVTSTVPGVVGAPAGVVSPVGVVPQTTVNGADFARYAAMIAQQGQVQQPGVGVNGAAAPAKPAGPPVKYYYKGTDPNDPLATVEMPERLFNNIPAPNY